MSDTPAAVAALRRAGWFPGRRIPTGRFRDHYRRFGFDPSPSVIAFLQEFGDLTVIVPRPERIGEKEERHHTNPLRVVGSYLRHGKFAVEERYAGEQQVPARECCNENLLLFVSDSGRIYHSTGRLATPLGRHGRRSSARQGSSAGPLYRRTSVNRPHSCSRSTRWT